MKKAPDAFRTISEVAEILDTPAHVLRFWESKFYQIRPVKRAGGRRYYRPDDVALINGIKTLLQDQGLTIRGVQRVLQEQGVKHVAGLGGPLPELDDADLEDAGLDDTGLGDIGLADQVFEPQDADEPPSAPRSDPAMTRWPVSSPSRRGSTHRLRSSSRWRTAPPPARPPPCASPDRPRRSSSSGCCATSAGCC